MTDQLEAEVQETVVTDDVIIESTEEAQTETTSETVSDSEEKHEEKSTFTPEQKATAEYAFKAREAKRENEELKRQLAEANQPKSVDRPAVPELQEFPEPEEIAARDKATQQAAVWDYQQEQQKEADYNAQVTAQNQQAEAANKLRSDFVTNSTQAGIKLEDLQIAGNVVDAHGLSPAIAQAIMADKEGGLALLHLATNPADIQVLNGANALTLGTIYADIKAKAAALKPKQSEAPPPAEILSGNGAPPKDGGPDGATYE
jgi:hypothetical protein